MNNNFNIGVFDSGVGGTTVLKEIINALPNENILYYDEMETMEHPGGQAETEDNAYLQKVDVNALNPAILQKFLSNGLQEETENFVKDYFYAIGQEPMESLVFRNYVILNVRFSVISFIYGIF